MKKMILLSILALSVLSGCDISNKSTSTDTIENNNKKSTNASKTIELAGDLLVPWSIQKNEDTFYISERPGTIAKVEDGTVTRQSLILSNELSKGSEAGLLGFLLDTNFKQNNEAFAYYTYVDDSETFNRLVKLHLIENEWRETEVLINQLPAGNYHDGGRLAYGPDYKLYVTVGDAYQLDDVQQIDKLSGKILRINPDGTVPNDNPFPNNYVYSYGHRNPQGLAWVDGEMYSSEHGDSANDEINLILAGQNYGWPIIEGEEKEGDMQTPLFTSGSDETWAPSGMAAWHNQLFVAALRGSAILKFDLEKHEKSNFITGYGRIRDVLIEGDNLYFITNNLDGRGDGTFDDDRLYQVQLK